MYDDDNGSFVANSLQTPLFRYVPTGNAEHTTRTVTAPLSFC